MARGPRATLRRDDWKNARSRALHLSIADKLRENPGVIARALSTIDRWEKQSGPNPGWTEWREILMTRSLPEIVDFLGDTSEDANRLRRCSPFAGVLTDEERMAIFRYFNTL